MVSISLVGFNSSSIQVSSSSSLIIFEFLQPLRIYFLFNQFGKHWQCFFTITPNRNCCFYILINFSRINIEMNNFCLLCIFIQSAGNTIIETHTHCNQYITFIG